MATLRQDQAQLYAIVDTSHIDPHAFKKTCQAILKGLPDLLQLRAKKDSKKERAKMLDSLLEMSEGTQTQILVNDDIQLAASRPPTGLHIGQTDTHPLKARDILGEQPLLGLSTHSIEEAQKAQTLQQTLNYFALGPIFPTPTKPTYQAIGLHTLQQVAQLPPQLPWICIGGITTNNAKTIINHGGKGLASVSHVLRSKNPTATLQALRTTLTTHPPKKT